MGKYSRLKGANYERELVHRFREAMPGVEVKRGLQSRGGGEVPDIDVAPFWPEAKRMKKPNILAALRQSCRDCPPNRIPLAITKADRDESVVTMLLDDFLDLINEWHELRSK